MTDKHYPHRRYHQFGSEQRGWKSLPYRLEPGRDSHKGSIRQRFDQGQKESY